ncbi:MAG: hypothetical protein L6R42_011022, partial [Xanthoria sp. 1 TBL-2021]
MFFGRLSPGSLVHQNGDGSPVSQNLQSHPAFSMQTPTWPSFNATLSNPGAIGQERQTIMERVLATTLLPEIRTCERLVNETGEG